MQSIPSLYRASSDTSRSRWWFLQCGVCCCFHATTFLRKLHRTGGRRIFMLRRRLSDFWKPILVHASKPGVCPSCSPTTNIIKYHGPTHVTGVFDPLPIPFPMCFSKLRKKVPEVAPLHLQPPPLREKVSVLHITGVDRRKLETQNNPRNQLVSVLLLLSISWWNLLPLSVIKRLEILTYIKLTKKSLLCPPLALSLANRETRPLAWFERFFSKEIDCK